MYFMNSKIYLCIDLKTFYASVECVERGLDPFKTDLIVADPVRGNGAICLAISPKMKQRGIRNRCRVWEIPNYVKPIVAKPRMKKYMEYSAFIYSIYLDFIEKNDIHVYSIDEAFLDITTYLKLYQKTPLEVAKMIMNAIYEKTGITATAGIGTNLYLTKIALDITAKHVKSNIGYLDEEKYKKELWNHTPLTDFWQIGSGIERRLQKFNITNMYDIAHCDEAILYKEFGINAKLLIDHANGIESCTIADIKSYKPKSNSISNSQILPQDYTYINARKVLIEMIDYGTLQLVSKGIYASVIGFSIGYSKERIPALKFTKKLDNMSNSFHTILNFILEEYDRKINKLIPIRRISISFGGVGKKVAEQIDLFSSYLIEEQDHKVESVMNQIKTKYGGSSILRGISYMDGATQKERNKLVGGHNAE